VLQPDFFKMGGLTEALRVARAAEACGIDVAPHFMPLVAAHLAAAQPNVVWLEELPLIEFLFGGMPRLDAEGRLAIGDAPGLGLAWDDGLAAEFRVAAE
jgi:L-alanine-DL-glutamate epimerase-like enolase superfamily enzyme